MMKKVLFILMIFSFTSTQVMALNCGVNCAVQESLNKQKNKSDMANHECCHGKKDKKEKKKSSNCMGEMSNSCFHEYTSLDKLPKPQNEISSKVVLLKTIPVINLIKLAGINKRYRPKIPDSEYLKFKANLNLYILKDQFLI